MADKLTVKFAKIISRERLPERTLLSGFYLPEDPKKAVLGKLFYFIEIVAPWFPNTQASQGIVKAFIENFYSQSSLDTTINLENALKGVNEKIADMAVEGNADWINNLNAILGVIKGDQIHFSQVGAISGNLIRGRKVSQITENLSLKKTVSPLKVFEQLVSGGIEAGDRIFFANNELYNHTSVDRVRSDFEIEQIEVGLEQVFRYLRKVRAKEVNVLAMDINTPEEFAKITLSNCPDTFYLDLPLDSRIQKYKRAARPYLVKAGEVSKKGYELSKKGFRRTYKYIREKASPKMAVLANKSKNIMLSGAKSANQKLMPKLKEFSDGRTFRKVKTVTGPYFTKGSSWSKRFFSYVSPYFRSLKFLWRPEYRKYLYIGFAVLILGLSYLKIRSNNSKQADLKAQQEIAASFDNAKEKFDLAATDIGLKRTEQGLAELYEALALAKTAAQSPVNKAKAEDLVSQIQTKIDAQIVAYRIKASDVFADEASTPPVEIIYLSNFVYSLSAKGQILGINIKTREQRMLASLPDGSGTLKAATASSDGLDIYMRTDSSRVFDFKPADDTVSELKIAGDSGEWESAVSLDEFAGNLYLLDSEAGIVWKHTPVAGGYSKGKDYLDTSKVSIKGAVDMAINGDIYVLLPDGSARRFTKGLLDETFVLKLLPAPDTAIRQPSRIINIDGQTGDLLLFDKSLNRFVRVNRAGDFQKQYLTDLGNIQSATVNSKINTAWVLVGEKIYQVSL